MAHLKRFDASEVHDELVPLGEGGL